MDCVGVSFWAECWVFRQVDLTLEVTKFVFKTMNTAKENKLKENCSNDCEAENQTSTCNMKIDINSNIAFWGNSWTKNSKSYFRGFDHCFNSL